jgi:2-methylcitrate dehydratase PrpD
VLEAYLAGLEVHSRLGQAEVAGWSASGAWLPIGHVSLMGAAAACAKLLRLPPDRIAHALGFAAHFSGALAVSNGALAKPLGSGEAARAGLESALLARAGGTAAADVVERAQGFADVYLGAGHDLPGKLAKLGAPHHLEEIGIAVKRYPSCYATHWGIDALLLLAAEHGLTAANVAAVTLEHPAAGAFCDNPDPRTPEAARFSHEYNLAVALLDGVPGPASYGPARIAAPDVQTLLAKVRTADHPPELQPPAAWEYRVTVETIDGQRHSRAVPRPLGHPRHPMSPADLEAKFRICVEPRLGAAAAGALLDQLRDFAALPDLDPLGALLAGAAHNATGA